MANEDARASIEEDDSPPDSGGERRTAGRDRRAFGINRQHVIASIAVLVMVLAALGVGLGIYASAHQNRIYVGVSVAGVDLGGKTRSQARALLEPVLAAYAAEPITLVNGDAEFTLDPAASGVRFDLDATADRAFAYGRGGSIVDRLGRWSRAMLHGANVRPAVMVDDTTLEATLAVVAEQVTTAPVNAVITLSGEGGPVIVPDQAGVGFDLTATKWLIVEHFATLSDEPIALVLPELRPEVATSDLEAGLAVAQGVATDSLLIRGPDGRAWRLDRDDLRAVVTFAANDGAMIVNTDALEALVASLAASIDRDVVNATAFVNDLDEVIVRQAVDARRVDQAGSVAAIEAAIRDGSTTAELIVESTPAAIQTEAAEAAAARIEALVGSGLELTWDEGSAGLTRRELLAALTIEIDPASSEPFTLGFDRSVLTSVLTPLFDSLASEPSNARLRLIDDSVTIVEPAQDGVVVDIAATVEDVRQAALANEPSVEVTLTRTRAEVTEDGYESIHLGDELATGSIRYEDSSESRRRNVERAAELLNGWLVAPGQVGSVVELIGEISEEAGFEIAFGVVTNQTGGVTTGAVVGGGVGLVSTALVQAIFWAGLPLVERHAHPYWVDDFGDPPAGMPGLDALIDVQDDYALDLRFENTTGNWIAIVLEADGEQIVVRIVGTDPGWTIQIDEPDVSDVVESTGGARIIESPELPTGTDRQVEMAGEGFKATIARVVTRDGETVSEDVLTSIYLPSTDTEMRGTGASAADD